MVSEGIFLHEGTFVPLPKLATEPFLKLWEQEVFKLLLAEGKITEEIVPNIRSWQHSGFSVDQNVRVEAKDTEGIQRLIDSALDSGRLFLVSTPMDRYGCVRREKANSYQLQFAARFAQGVLRGVEVGNRF